MQKNLILLAFVIAMAGCQTKPETEKKVNASIHVKAKTVTMKDGLSDLRYSGTVEASQTIPLTFQSTGTVEQVLVQEGDVVRKGQLLAVVNKADNQSIYNSSLATYQKAKDGYDRLKQVYDKGSLTEVKWVEMETNMKQAESQLQIAKNNLDKCNLYAPASGVVGSRNIEPGQSALSTLAPIELVKIETVLVKIAVPENEIGKIKKGLKAGFVISALGDKKFEGVITHVGVVADRFSRTYEVKIEVNNKDMEMKPGMVCDVNLALDEGSHLLVVPYQAVSVDMKGNPYVWIVNSDKRTVKKMEVKLGSVAQNGIEVLSGLVSNDLVVVEGKEKLSDDSIINL
ncbi:MAG TPA: efflux RND transporter periplasmic adaptor subunit [Prolixibacteraceae bacterium]|jgi:RND family efflux transporter MFP subunit|nr:efflux RND transporter periplasmic adaptor subunit [Prolixibacteraceae bacterium]